MPEHHRRDSRVVLDPINPAEKIAEVTQQADEIFLAMLDVRERLASADPASIPDRTELEQLLQEHLGSLMELLIDTMTTLANADARLAVSNGTVLATALMLVSSTEGFALHVHPSQPGQQLVAICSVVHNGLPGVSTDIASPTLRQYAEALSSQQTPAHHRSNWRLAWRVPPTSAEGYVSPVNAQCVQRQVSVAIERLSFRDNKDVPITLQMVTPLTDRRAAVTQDPVQTARELHTLLRYLNVAYEADFN